jgi:hypothetical protein
MLLHSFYKPTGQAIRTRYPYLQILNTVVIAGVILGQSSLSENAASQPSWLQLRRYLRTLTIPTAAVAEVPLLRLVPYMPPHHQGVFADIIIQHRSMVLLSTRRPIYSPVDTVYYFKNSPNNSSNQQLTPEPNNIRRRRSMTVKREAGPTYHCLTTRRYELSTGSDGIVDLVQELPAVEAWIVVPHEYLSLPPKLRLRDTL